MCRRVDFHCRLMVVAFTFLIQKSKCIESASWWPPCIHINHWALFTLDFCSSWCGEQCNRVVGEPINLQARDLARSPIVDRRRKKGIKKATGSPECPPNVEAHRVEPEEGGQEEVVHQHGWNEKKAASYYLCAAEIYNSGDPFKARARALFAL